MNECKKYSIKEVKSAKTYIPYIPQFERGRNGGLH